LDAHVLRSKKTSDALIAFGRVNLNIELRAERLIIQTKTHVGKDKKNFGLVRVCDPHLGAVDDPVITILFGTCLEGKRV